MPTTPSSNPTFATIQNFDRPIENFDLDMTKSARGPEGVAIYWIIRLLVTIEFVNQLPFRKKRLALGFCRLSAEAEVELEIVPAKKFSSLRDLPINYCAPMFLNLRETQKALHNLFFLSFFLFLSFFSLSSLCPFFLAPEVCYIFTVRQIWEGSFTSLAATSVMVPLPPPSPP